MIFENNRAFAQQQDLDDRCAEFRSCFHIPSFTENRSCIYFCGNSLGLQPKSVRGTVEEVLDIWSERAVDGHFAGPHPWFPYHEYVTQPLANLVGAKPVEVVAMNSLTVNLHLMMVSFFRPTRQRHKILIEKNAFPSDRYAVLSQLQFHGLNPSESLIEVEAANQEPVIRNQDLVNVIEREGDAIALILLPGVQYYTGQAFDLETITTLGRAKGCRVGLDLAHAIGNLELALHQWQVDFAVWCSYKYLNAGPGAVGGCFVHERHARKFDLPRFTGWWGHDKQSRFEMPPGFDPSPGAEGWQISNPQILSLAPLLASLEIFDRVGMARLRTKSKGLTAYLEYLLKQNCADKLRVLTPANDHERGAQLSLVLTSKDANRKSIHRRLTTKGVVCDWREPDVLRIAPVPLYNRFTEVYDFVTILRSVLQS